MVNFFKENTVFSFIFLLAVVIRIIPITQYQFSYDELCGLRNSLFSDWHDLINYGVKLDTHPVLVQLIINLIAKTIGYNEAWIKLPFILFSLATIIYGYLFALKWLGKCPALISVSLFSFSYLFLFYAPLARMYAGGLFFCTALTYYLFEICFNDQKRTKHYVLFVFFILLCALNNHLSCLYSLSCGFFGLFYQNRKTVLKYLSSCAIAILLYLPHLSVTMFQLSMGGIGHSQNGWLAAPDKWVLFSFLKTLFGTGYVWVIYIFLFFVSFIIKGNFLQSNKFRENPGTVNGKKNKVILLLLLFLFNYSVIHLYSVYKAPVFQYSVMLFSAPCFIWAFSAGINFKGKFSVGVISLFSIILIYQSLVVKHFFSNAVLNQNEFESKEYCKLADKLGKRKVEAYFMGSQRYFVVHYELKYRQRFNYFIGEDFAGISAFKKQIRTSKAEYVILGEPTETQLAIVKEYFPCLNKHVQTLNVNNYIFSKSGTSLNVFEKTMDESSYFAPGKYQYNLNASKLNGKTYSVDSLEEFCLSAKTEVKKLKLKEGNVIFAEVQVQSTEPLTEVGFNYSVTNEKDSTLFFGGPETAAFYTAGNGSYYVYSELFVGSDIKMWLNQNSKITFFFWNRSKRKFKLSDFKIKTIDYWPERWGWWD